MVMLPIQSIAQEEVEAMVAGELALPILMQHEGYAP